ncbi:FMN-binding protein [Rathayibacter sp. YIM 133350]|uniref:FMN-binding protein n=1 Tax=Rathayibacter sp. YIM 133350 TaxID=3131992 RepID=UPI00307E0069
MRARVIVISGVASAAVLGWGWQAGHTEAAASGATTLSAPAPVSPDATTPAAASPSATDAPATPTPAEPTPADPTPAEPTPAAATAASGTFDGTAVETRFGTVQVRVSVSDGSITDVTALHLTDRESRSVAISNQAAPILRSEVMQAQSASVDTVSGATYTSEAYLQSLQSALDAAGFTG